MTMRAWLRVEAGAKRFVPEAALRRATSASERPSKRAAKESVAFTIERGWAR
jgi:hypothetical protein